MSSKGALPKTRSVTSKNELSSSKIQTRLSQSGVIDPVCPINRHKEFPDCGCGEEKDNVEKESGDDFKFELKPKPKKICIPQANFKETPLNRFDDGQLQDPNEVNVVFKSRQMQESTLSVLFVGSSSTLNCSKEDKLG